MTHCLPFDSFLAHTTKKTHLDYNQLCWWFSWHLVVDPLTTLNSASL